MPRCQGVVSRHRVVVHAPPSSASRIAGIAPIRRGTPTSGATASTAPQTSFAGIPIVFAETTAHVEAAYTAMLSRAYQAQVALRRELGEIR